MRDGLSIFDAAKDAGDRLALITDDERFTFAALAERCAAVAASLHACGVRSGDRVAVRGTNRAQTVATLLALAELGACAVLIHPRLTEREAAAQIDDAKVYLALDDAAMEAMLHGGAKREECPLISAADPSSSFAMLYTSGTAGSPKAAMLSRYAFAAAASASEDNLRWRSDDAWLCALPVCHVGGLSIVTRCLRARKPVRLLDRFDEEAVLSAVRAGEGSLLSVVPTMLQRLLERDGDNVLSTVRAMLVGGAAMSDRLRQECARRSLVALATYGLTEACSQVASQRLRDRKPEVEYGSGRALAGVQLAVLRSDGAEAAEDEIGSIAVRGATMMRGYWRRDPLVDGEWFNTGDIGSLAHDGTLTVVSRRTDLIVTGGENVYPAEVERAIESVDGVSAALVFAVDDERWGQLVAAAVVGDPERALELEIALRNCLAAYKRPRRIAYVSALPTTAAGKLDRAGAARALAASLRPFGP